MALTNKEKSQRHRDKQKRLKRTKCEYYLSDSEQKIIKPIVRDKLKELRAMNTENVYIEVDDIEQEVQVTYTGGYTIPGRFNCLNEDAYPDEYEPTVIHEAYLLDGEELEVTEDIYSKIVAYLGREE